LIAALDVTGPVEPSPYRQYPFSVEHIVHKSVTARQARRGVAWTAAIALLVNILTVMPLLLRMAVPAEALPVAYATCPMGMAGAGHGSHNPIDHSHCLVCQGGVGAAMLAATIEPTGPTLAGVVVRLELPAAFPARATATAYTSRAPPIAA
jgi:hypothetical protein